MLKIGLYFLPPKFSGKRLLCSEAVLSPKFPNNKFAIASKDNTIRIWDQTTFECFTILQDHSDIVYGLAVKNNQTFISISADKTIKVWDINSFSKVSTTLTSANLYSLAIY